MKLRTPPRVRVEEALTAALFPARADIARRRANVQSSTFASEVFSCSIDGQEIDLLCKRGPTVYESGHGHRGGVAYEASVYRDVLAKRDLGTPHFYGSHSDDDGITWLFIEYLPGTVRVSKSPDDTAMLRAARWAGTFHRRLADGAQGPPALALKKYDASYYGGWVERTLAFSPKRRFPWLRAVCESFAAMVAPQMVSAAQTVIHGEYTVKNVLVSTHGVHPVDWQSAAVGIGELDLVTLVEGWDRQTVERCRRAYVAERWGNTPPADAAWMLDAAETFNAFRWLGDRRSWTNDPRSDWRFAALLESAKRLELV